MNALKVIELLEKYGKCPECGSEVVGENQGKLEIDDNTFKRQCACGYRVSIQE